MIPARAAAARNSSIAVCLPETGRSRPPQCSPDPHDPSSTVSAALRERIPTQLFLEHGARRLDPVVRRYLEGCLEAPFSFHEALRCDPGRGFNARDLFTGEERDVM